MIKGVIFDADGTLLDSTAMWIQAGARYLETQGIVVPPDLGRELFPLTPGEVALLFQRRFGITKSVPEIIQGANEVVRRFYLEEVTLKPGVVPFLERLKALDIPMTMATATEYEVICEVLARTGIRDYFGEVFTCGRVGRGKEQPDIYLAAKDFMGTPPEATWVFEDALHGVETAFRAGFRVVGVHDAISEGVKGRIMASSHLYLQDLTDFDQFYPFAQGMCDEKNREGGGLCTQP